MSTASFACTPEKATINGHQPVRMQWRDEPTTPPLADGRTRNAQLPSQSGLIVKSTHCDIKRDHGICRVRRVRSFFLHSQMLDVSNVNCQHI